MPGVSGIEVSRFLKENDDTRYIEIIVMTGYPTRNNLESVIAAGARECLTKPINAS